MNSFIFLVYSTFKNQIAEIKVNLFNGLNNLQELNSPVHELIYINKKIFNGMDRKRSSFLSLF